MVFVIVVTRMHEVSWQDIQLQLNSPGPSRSPQQTLDARAGPRLDDTYTSPCSSALSMTGPSPTLEGAKTSSLGASLMLPGSRGPRITLRPGKCGVRFSRDNKATRRTRPSCSPRCTNHWNLFVLAMRPRSPLEVRSPPNAKVLAYLRPSRPVELTRTANRWNAVEFSYNFKLRSAQIIRFQTASLRC